MKMILVPTDFSENSKLALKHAIKIINQVGGTLSVLHVFQTTTITGSFETIDEVVRNEREEELSKLINEMNPLLDEGAHIKGYVKKGPSIDTICQTADSLNASMIVMGTTGADGMKKFFLGSTASNVILESSKPVLAIPKEFTNFKISNITLALDNKTVQDDHTLKPFIDFAKQFDAVLSLLTVMDEENPAFKTDPSVQDLLKKHGIDSTYHKVSSNDVEKGILEFVEKEDSDMICLIHHPKGLFQSIFHSSVAEKIAFESKVPLFVFND